MKLFIYLILICCGLSCSTLSAQFQNKTYQAESIYLRGNRYVKNGIDYRIGVFGGKMENEFLDKPMANGIFQRFRRKRTTAAILGFAGLGAFLGSIPAFNNNQPELAVGLYLIGLGAITISMPINTGAYNDLNQAIWLRNGEILK